LFDAVASKDKAIVQIEGADHYYTSRRELLPKAAAEIVAWLDARSF